MVRSAALVRLLLHNGLQGRPASFFLDTHRRQLALEQHVELVAAGMAEQDAEDTQPTGGRGGVGRARRAFEDAVGKSR